MVATSIPYSQALLLRQICLEDSHLEMWTRELKEHLLKRGVSWEATKQRIHQTPVCNHIPTRKVCSNAAGGHRPPYSANLPIDHQMPSPYPSYLRMAMEGSTTFPIDSFSPAKKFKVSFCLSIFDYYQSRATWQLSLQSCWLQSFPPISII